MVINNLKFLLKTVTLALVLPILNMSVNGMDMNPRNLEENYRNNNNIDFTYDEFEKINIVAKENNSNNWAPVFKQALIYNNENSSLNKVLNVNLKELSKTFNGVFDFNKRVSNFYEFYNKVLGKNFENLPIILSSSDTENLNYIKSILKYNVLRDTLIAFNVDSVIKNMTKEFVFAKLNGDINNIYKNGNITTCQNQIREYIVNENAKNHIFIDSIFKINVKNPVAQQIRNIISNYLIKGVYKYTEIKFRKLIDKLVEFLKDYYNK